jgi:hypothetical protein
MYKYYVFMSLYMSRFSVCNVWPPSHRILPSCLLIVNQNIFPYLQNVFILRSVSNSALSGAINSREFIDLVGNYYNWGGAGVYISSGKITVSQISIKGVAIAQFLMKHH